MFTSDLFRRLQEVISSADRFLVRLKLSARRTMKKQILIVLVLVVLTVLDRARGANQTVAAPGNNPSEDSNEALSLLATAADASDGTPGALVSTNISTNKPVWDGTVAFGLTATAGNSDSALVTGNFLTHRKTPLDEWTLGADAAYGEVSFRQKQRDPARLCPIQSPVQRTLVRLLAHRRVARWHRGCRLPADAQPRRRLLLHQKQANVAGR